MAYRKWLRWPWVLAAVAAAGAAGLAWMRAGPVTVAVAAPEQAVPLAVFGLGTVEAEVTSRAGFEAAGLVVELLADFGDRVAAGQVLARLSDAQQRARVAQAESAADRARADLGKAAAQVARARAVLQQRQQVNRRRQSLAESSAVSRQAAEDAIADVAIAAADLDLALAETEVVRAAVRESEAALRHERAVLDRHVLTAPYDAVVVTRHVGRGAVVNAGEAVFTLVDPASVWVRLFVEESRAGMLAPGQPAEVRLRSHPKQVFKGRVARIDIEADRASEERRVQVACTDCPAAFHLGEQAEAVIGVGSLERALMVPRTMVAGFDGHSGLVWTVEDGRLARRRVPIGQATLDGRMDVADGVPPGAQVVTVVGDGAREGRAARIEAGGGGPRP